MIRRHCWLFNFLAASVSIYIAWGATAICHAAITIDTVLVGNPGKANDPATGNLYGGVAYNYRIGKYEVTVGQYTALLNAVAADDTYALYNTQMASDLNIAGIARSGVSGSYSYRVIGSANHPVTYVSWGDAARFSNWLHNGQPTGAQNVSTTEDGAYTLNGATTNAALNSITRNAGAKWFIPSENEWYKAAYHQPAAQGGDADNYWAYPTRTNSKPNSDKPPGDPSIQTNVANFYGRNQPPPGSKENFAVTGTSGWSVSQNYLTDVGAYTHSPSFYGTFDQGGNVSEWNEALIERPGGLFRGTRGGSWASISDSLLSSNRGSDIPGDGNVSFVVVAGDGNYGFGFRVATVAP
jgi:formylglycine-generating enzyme required for sulfatase activity